MISSMIGRMHHVVLDCPDPGALAGFYSALLGVPVTYGDSDWVVVAGSDTPSDLAFQRAPDNRPPTWPHPAVPQQFHLDIMVEDVAAARPRLRAGCGKARRRERLCRSGRSSLLPHPAAPVGARHS
jgi:catechol 2,3-dioxygenase-like lactoylglutathione lyase family enzyme